MYADSKSHTLDEDAFTDLNADLGKKYAEIIQGDYKHDDDSAVQGELLLLYVLVDKYHSEKQIAEERAGKALLALHQIQSFASVLDTEEIEEELCARSMGLEPLPRASISCARTAILTRSLCLRAQRQARL